MSTKSKRAWRAKNPERRREAERQRADYRRNGYPVRTIETPSGPFVLRDRKRPGCVSYHKYEVWKRPFAYYRRRAQATEDRLAATNAVLQIQALELLARVGGPDAPGTEEEKIARMNAATDAFLRGLAPEIMSAFDRIHEMT